MSYIARGLRCPDLYTKKKNPCFCQSCIDSRKSQEVAERHTAGQFCNEDNICSICSKIKNIARTLRHLGGAHEETNKKCNLCKYFLTFGKIYVARSSTTSEKFLSNALVMKLYKHMLYKKG